MRIYQIRSYIFAVFILLSTLSLGGCAELKEFGDWLAEPPPPGTVVTFPKGDHTSASNIDDVFARLDGHFYFESPPSVTNPIGSWNKARGAQLKVIPGVSYEVQQPYTVYKGKIRSAYRGYSKNGQLWVWISLKKNGSGTKVKYKISGARNLIRAAEIMEDWIKESV